jgi:hypothetical protein
MSRLAKPTAGDENGCKDYSEVVKAEPGKTGKAN